MVWYSTQSATTNIKHECTIAHWHPCSAALIISILSVRSHCTLINQYRLEVEAKLPRGDWIWPAVWLLPEDDAYGRWPASGEIDMLESRGNRYVQVPLMHSSSL
jgi:Glycosyl hydrolases family 16